MWRSLRQWTRALVGRASPARMLFDRSWYLAQNSDVPAVQSNPWRHFLEVGAFEGRDPNQLFDCAWYLEQNSDVRAAGLNPLVHFVKQGWREGRNPHPLFDTRRFFEANPEAAASGLDPLTCYFAHWRAGVRPPTPTFRSQWYLERYPDLRVAGVEPFGHFLRVGAFEGRNPNPLFDCVWYLERNPDVRAAGLNPLVHFVIRGWREGRDPHVLFQTRRFLEENPQVEDSGLDPLAFYLTSWRTVRPPTPLFQSQWYLERYSDVRVAEVEPLGHFLDVGAFEGQDPNPLFDCASYLARNPDVRAAGVNPLVHFVKWGWRDGRDPHALFDTRRFLEANPEARNSGLDPLTYYLTFWRTGVRPPTPIFRSQWYLERYPDVRAAGVEPLGHYLSVGAAEDRNPNPLFDGRWYREANPDVAKAGADPLTHYLSHGSAEGRPANHLIKGRWYIDRVSDAGVETGDPTWEASFAARTGPFGAGFDVLADFSDRDPGSIERLHLDRELGSRAGGLTLLVREGDWPDAAGNAASHAARHTSATQGLGAAVRDAAARGHHLLIVAGGVQLTVTDVERLVTVFEADPMIGFAVPRLATAEGILPLLPPGDADAPSNLDRRVVDHLPELQFAPEFLGPCMILRAQLVANIPNFPAHFATMSGALHAMLTWSRRIGYRAAIANRVVLPIRERAHAYPRLSSKEQEILVGFFPDATVAAHRFKTLSCHRREALLAAAVAGAAAGSGRLLLDCSGMRPFHNGTSECILGILDGLAQVAPEWPVDVLIPDEAAAFHRMQSRYPMFNVDEDHHGPYTSAVRLSQPWTIEDIERLHARALYIYFFIFDTISWDTIYSTLHEVERTWAFAAGHADGFYYDSHFTMARFNSRFAVAPHSRQLVTHLSFNFDEYKGSVRAGDRAQSHVLIVGNDHDHKGLDQALSVLPEAFPTQQFVTIGSRKIAYPNVRSVRSGLMSAEEIDRLFAEARMIVYPSFYEGFGLPIVKGLSEGLDVVARRSELLYEIAANCAPRGRIVPFDDPASLVAAVGGCLAGSAVETLALGGALAEAAPIGWRDVAARIVDTVAAAARDPGSAVHDRRETALRAIAPTLDAHNWLGRMTA